jgi:8-oxo-dGTP diphosphatase
MQVREWTGREAAALQSALRLSNEGFAARLGIAARTVAGWHAKPGLRPRTEMQQLLDTLLDGVTPAEQARFCDQLQRNPEADETTAQCLRAAIAVVVRDSDVLLVCRRSEDASPLRWQFPAGIVKPGASSERIAEWETLGETGVRCIVREQLGSRLHPTTHVMCDYFMCDFLGGEAANLDPVENVDVAWAPLDRLTSFIPAASIYPPILQALEGLCA